MLNTKLSGWVTPNFWTVVYVLFYAVSPKKHCVTTVSGNTENPEGKESNLSKVKKKKMSLRTHAAKNAKLGGKSRQCLDSSNICPGGQVKPSVPLTVPGQYLWSWSCVSQQRQPCAFSCCRWEGREWRMKPSTCRLGMRSTGHPRVAVCVCVCV